MKGRTGGKGGEGERGRGEREGRGERGEGRGEGEDQERGKGEDRQIEDTTWKLLANTPWTQVERSCRLPRIVAGEIVVVFGLSQMIGEREKGR